MKKYRDKGRKVIIEGEKIEETWKSIKIEVDKCLIKDQQETDKKNEKKK